MLRLLILASIVLIPNLALSQPAIQLVPTDDVPEPTNLNQVSPSKCQLEEPSEGALMRYWSKGVGTYTAYGDKNLLPIGVIATHEGYPASPGDRLTFGSRTRILMPYGDVLHGQPTPVVPFIGSILQLVRVSFVESNSEKTQNDTFTYTYPLISPFWEIVGSFNPGEPQRSVCLYLKEDPH